MTPSISIDELDAIGQQVERIRAEVRFKTKEWEDAMLLLASEVGQLKKRLRGQA